MKQGQKWYNNGTIDKAFFENEVPNGFILGRLYRPDEITKRKISNSNIGNQNHLKDGKHLRKPRIEAWKYFYPEGNGKRKPGYDLHHIDMSLKYNDYSRYQQWNIEDLIMITHSEHMSLHAKDKHINGILKPPMLGKHFSKESRLKMRLSHLGKSNPHDGNKNIMKKVRCIETQEEFESISKAFEKYNCQHISQVCNGVRKTAGGLHWEWIV